MTDQQTDSRQRNIAQRLKELMDDNTRGTFGLRKIQDGEFVLSWHGDIDGEPSARFWIVTSAEATISVIERCRLEAGHA
jgi:hypothetical protein